ncbi:MAG TPA: hypothetical protein VKP13_15540 [Nitrospira sp.]|nr:hypothetical protein [Nitrospira sp.]
MATESKMTIIDISGPFREPREPAFSYDFSIQRTNWPTPHAVRVKVGIAEELDVLRSKILGPATGTPGQQLVISRLLTRRIAEEKIRIAEAEGHLLERREVSIPPFAGPYFHLFPRLESWFEREREALREEIKKRVNL